MFAHIRANLMLLILTVVLCCVVYPLVLWGVGQTLFAGKAEGGLIGADGKPAAADNAVGARLIAQPFSGPEYFKPRPSAASYNAAASGGSNFGASNPLLRDRVARQLGPIVTYTNGKPVGPDVEAWFAAQVADDARKPVEERFAVRWARDNPAIAEQWLKDNIDAVARSLGREVDAVKAATAESTPLFFRHFAGKHPGSWPTSEEYRNDDGKPAKRIAAVKTGADVQAYHFDAWLQAHPKVELTPIPADRVMASGSGLDPHITRANAESQLDGIVTAWTARSGLDRAAVAAQIQKVLNDKSEAPFGGLVGVPLVNLLEVNLALRAEFAAPANWTRISTSESGCGSTARRR